MSKTLNRQYVYFEWIKQEYINIFIEVFILLEYIVLNQRPGEFSMIEFCCTNCGHHIRLSDAYAGKRGRCPKCKTVLIVPQNTDIELQKDVFDISRQDRMSREVVSEHQNINEVENQTRIDQFAGDDQEQSESAPVRKIPAFLDIFLYPTSAPGLIIIGIVVGIPLLLDILSSLAGPFWFFIWIPGLIISVVIFLYSYWYICECVRDSAEGNIRAPDVLVNSPTLPDMFFQTLRIILCLLIFAAPVLFYYLRTQRIDNIFYILLGLSVFFFPMGLLLVIMFDALSGLNPFILIVSVFKTFFQYIGLVLLFYIIGIFTVYQLVLLDVPVVLTFLITALNFYFVLVLAHLLGRFYWRYQDKLGWDV